MDVWQEYVGKKIFLRTRNNRTYSGLVLQVDDNDKQIIFITIKDSRGMLVTFVHSEVLEVKEEK